MGKSSGSERRRRVLVIDPDPVYRAGLEELLSAHCWVAIPYANTEIPWRQLAGGSFDALWMEWDQRGLLEGADLLRRVHEAAPDVPLLVVTASSEIAQAAAAARAVGAMAFSKSDALMAVHRMAEMLDARALDFDQSGEHPAVVTPISQRFG